MGAMGPCVGNRVRNHDNRRPKRANPQPDSTVVAHPLALGQDQPDSLHENVSFHSNTAVYNSNANHGEVAERFNAPVLKTGVGPVPTVGSNPSLSASKV